MQYLGFGVPASESPGRRAASLADQAHQSAVTSAEEDNAEKDAYLKQVEARDLIEFGMIPVSYSSSCVSMPENAIGRFCMIQDFNCTVWIIAGICG